MKGEAKFPLSSELQGLLRSMDWKICFCVVE